MRFTFWGARAFSLFSPKTEDSLVRWKVLESIGIAGLERKSSWKRGMQESVTRPQLSDEVRAICRIIARRSWGPRVEKALALSAIRLTSDHIVGVLKLQNDKKRALRFFLWALQQNAYALDSDAYYTIIHMWDYSQAIKNFLNALKWLRRIDCKMTDSMFTTLMKGYGLAGMADAAYETFEKMKMYGCIPTVINFSCLLHVLIQENRLDVARSVYQRMRRVGCSPNAWTYGMLLHGFYKTGKYDEAIDLLYMMVEEGVTPHVAQYRLLVYALLKTEKYNRVWELHRIMKDKGHCADAVINNVLIDVFSKEGYVYEVEILLDETMANGFIAYGVYKSAIQSLLKRAERAKMDRFLKMDSQGCRKPDLVSYNSLIDGFLVSDRIQEAYKLWVEMRKEGYVPDGVISITLIRDLFRAGLPDNAFKVAELVLKETHAHDVTIHRSLMAAFCQAGYLDKALEVKAEMARNGFFLDYSGYRSLIACLCLMKRVEEAYAMMKEMDANGCSPDIFLYNTAVSSFCKAGMVSEAFNLMDEMRKGRCNPDEYTLNTLMSSFCKSGKLAEAEKFLGEMTSEGCAADGVTYNILINGFLKIGDWQAAYHCLNNMMQSGWDPDVVTYTVIIAAFCRVGYMEAARKLMGEMWNNGVTPDTVTYITMIHGLCKADRIVEAHKLLGEAIEKDYIQSDDAHSILAGYLLKAGKQHAASELPHDFAVESAFLDLITDFHRRQ